VLSETLVPSDLAQHAHLLGQLMSMTACLFRYEALTRRKAAAAKDTPLRELACLALQLFGVFCNGGTQADEAVVSPAAAPLAPVATPRMPLSHMWKRRQTALSTAQQSRRGSLAASMDSFDPDREAVAGARDEPALASLLFPSVQLCGWALSMAPNSNEVPGVQWVLDAMDGMQAEVRLSACLIMPHT
jgi:hypothetical protein